jgi:hypothetical protein
LLLFEKNCTEAIKKNAKLVQDTDKWEDYQIKIRLARELVLAAFEKSVLIPSLKILDRMMNSVGLKEKVIRLSVGEKKKEREFRLLDIEAFDSGFAGSAADQLETLNLFFTTISEIKTHAIYPLWEKTSAEDRIKEERDNLRVGGNEKIRIGEDDFNNKIVTHLWNTFHFLYLDSKEKASINRDLITQRNLEVIQKAQAEVEPELKRLGLVWRTREDGSYEIDQEKLMEQRRAAGPFRKRELLSPWINLLEPAAELFIEYERNSADPEKITVEKRKSIEETVKFLKAELSR